MVVGYDEITYGWGILLVMIWLIPLTLYGFYKWKDKQEFRA